jgi:hypothetical protein
MITVLFGVDGVHLLDILPTDAKLAFDYFCKNILEILEDVAYPDGRPAGTIRYILHFGNSPVCKTKKIQQKFNDCNFRRLNHPPHAPDLAFYGFFLFGGLHEKMKLFS